MKTSITSSGDPVTAWRHDTSPQSLTIEGAACDFADYSSAMRPALYDLHSFCDL
ncbi:uncharacterized protein METZ01_LOCUS31768 [marine metagenome]|uniref:Uncharacterized protein n=1 Tax=marine metagenome TaxID=408172 RepID=A0A381QJ31_9ZZZZ